MATNQQPDYLREMSAFEQQANHAQRKIDQAFHRSMVNLQNDQQQFSKKRIAIYTREMEQRTRMLQEFHRKSIGAEQTNLQQRLTMALENEQIIHQGRMAHIEQWRQSLVETEQVVSGPMLDSVRLVDKGISKDAVGGLRIMDALGKRILRTFISMTLQLIAMKTALAAMSGGGLGLLFHHGGAVLHHGGAARPVPRHHYGERIRGNEMPAILERGEYVVKRRAVQRPGVRALLEGINSGGQTLAGGSTIVEGATYNISISTLDASDMERVVNEKIIPQLERAQRRRAYTPWRES